MGTERRKQARRDDDKECEEMATEAKRIAESAVTAVSTHERICAERYGRLIESNSLTVERIKRLEHIIMGAAAFLVASSLIIKALAVT